MKQRNKTCAVLPILGSYLAFIHYFGFSINPAAPPLPPTSSNTFASEPLATHLKLSTDKRVQLSDWSKTAPERRWWTCCRYRWTFSAATCLWSVIKFTAISFTTFIATNHCLVLADYIYQGNKAYEELMFDARLVLTKLSALIFVLSWHRNQAKVRRLIRMVKSTSVYIMSSYNSDDPAPITSTGNFLWLQGRQRIATQVLQCSNLNNHHMDAQWADIDGAPPIPDSHLQTFNESLPITGTNQMDRNVLRWWFMCVFVIVLHFLLSEVEIFKSHHLWQWLDDYSMHQLSNETTSSSTLMFLASFDNYIYTVHVYGTRLIGASIICIVCSLQCANIEKLRWHTLQLLKTSSELRAGSLAEQNDLTSSSSSSSPSLPPAKHLSGGGGGCWCNSANTRRYNDQNCNYANNQQQQQQKQKHKQQPLPRQRQQGESDRNKLLMSDTDSNGSCSSSAAAAATHSQSAPPGNHHHRLSLAPDQLENDISCLADCDLFFILGDSNWLKVRENTIRLRPCGYLSLSIWRAKRRLSSQASRFVRLVAECCICMRLFSLQQQQQPGAQFIKPPNDQSQVSTTLHISQKPARSGRVTPTLHTCTSVATLGQVTRSLVATNCELEVTTPKVVLVGDDDDDVECGLKVDWQLHNSSDLSRLEQVNFAAVAAAAAAAGRHNLAGYPKVHLPEKSATISEESSEGNQFSAADLIERQLEGLASKYELVRTVNANIDSCFGHMLLIQYSFLFLMSCIDVVYFSIYFNPNTKTKYIIISGMILLWWPYLLLYKFASDLGTSSKELLISVRRLARLSLIEYHSKAHQQQQQHKEASTARCAGTGEPLIGSHKDSLLSFLSSSRKAEFRANLNGSSRSNLSDETHDNPKRPLHLAFKSYLRHRSQVTSRTSSGKGCTARVRVINKLDNVFKPTNLSIIGIMTIDKFFLLNFAKIVITASVMIIQFISHMLDG